MNNYRKKYVCKFPFTYSEIANSSQWLCCPSWLPEDIKETDNFEKNWYSEKSNKIRKSILDGSYKYCDAKQCPYLADLDTGKVHRSHFVEKSRFEKEITVKPSVINMGFDASCNLQCPSCRLDYVNLVGEDRARINRTIDKVSDEIGKYIETMVLCGAADPFFSKSFFNFMRTFDKTKFPRLKYIHLHTNAQLWTPKYWNYISKVHKYIQSCEISIDAATKDTYENKVRLRGDWDKLIDNIKFVLTINRIRRIRFSFVTQTKNYKEIYPFYELITELTSGTNKKIEILYNGIVDWGAYPTKEDFLKEEIHNPNHPEYPEFVQELEKIKNFRNVFHNFHHIVKRDTILI